MIALDDAQLLDAFRRGKQAAFGVLVDRHGEAIKGFALRMLHDRAQAEDVYADSFVRLAEAKGVWDQRGSVRGFLFTIARNLCFDLLRKRAVQRRMAPTVREIEEFRVPTPNPEAAVLLGERARLLEAALAKLPVEHREILLLRTVHGLTAVETAEAVGSSADQVDSALSYCRKRLRVLLDEPVASRGVG